MKAKRSTAGVAKAHQRETEIGSISRFTTLGDGWCYISDPRNGKSYHVKINSPEFWARLEELQEKVSKESLQAHAQVQADRFPAHTGWPIVVETLAS